MTIKVAFTGFGRMGRHAAKAVHESENMEVVAVYDLKEVGKNIGLLCGCDLGDKVVLDPSEIEDLEADVVIDFTTANAVLQNSEIIAKKGAAYIVGTTGLTEAQIGSLKANMEGLGLLISPNMSVGVNVFWLLVGEAAEKLKGYDIEVIEAHHKCKKDAPSGTALKAVNIICKKTGKKIKKDVVFGRHGDSLRKEDEIGVHSIRAADIVGEHTVLFSTEGERFEIKHQAHTRESFATGIPQAVNFIYGKKGVYDMWDVLGLSEKVKEEK